MVKPSPLPPTRGGGEEKRVDPADGRKYSKSEFIAQYKGVREWNAAAPGAAPRSAGRGAPVERRIDPADNKSYTKENFISCYGGLKEWNRAAPYNATAVGRGRGRR